MSADAVAGGGGVLGVVCAYELARAGARVTLVEREPDVGRGCSYGNAGLVGAGIALPLATPQALREGLASFFRRDAPFRLRPRPALLPWLLPFALACRPAVAARAAEALAPVGTQSFARHLDYVESGLDVGVVHRGALLTWETEARFAAGVRELRAAGAEMTVLDAAGARAREPGLVAPLAVAVEDVAHCDSGQWTRGVAAAGRELGVDTRTGVEARRLLVGRGAVLGVDSIATAAASPPARPWVMICGLDSRPAGIAAWYGGPDPLVFNLAVLPDQRGRGIDAATMARAPAGAERSAPVNTAETHGPVDLYRRCGSRMRSTAGSAT